MCVICKATYTTAAVALALKGLTSPAPISAKESLGKVYERVQQLEKSSSELQKFKVEIPIPKWHDSRHSSTPQARNDRIVYYSVESKGAVSSSLADFATQAHQTLNDNRGWARLGISFKQVEFGGSFKLILSEAKYLPSFSSGCSSEWSCRVGSNVIINDSRWARASNSWNLAGGNLRDYRHMVINHEVGHWLGHGHYNCSGANNLAPVMQQQSISLQGCKFNPWPLDFELVSSQLGIDRRK